MKKFLLPVMAFALLTSATLTSCKKDDDEPTKTELITGTWTSDFEADDNNNNKQLDADEKIITTPAQTMTYIFNANGTGSATGGIIITSLPFTWDLLNNESQIRIDITGLGADTSRIHTLTSSSFVTENEDAGDMDWIGLKK